MTNEKPVNTPANAVIVVFLGTALLFSVVLVDGTVKWLIAGLLFIAMIAFLIPVLRRLRGRNNK